MQFKSHFSVFAAATSLVSLTQASPGCGNHNPSHGNSRQLLEIVNRDHLFSRHYTTTNETEPSRQAIVIPTYMHAAVPSNAADDYVTETDLRGQFDIINEAYAPYDISFELIAMERTVQDNISVFSYIPTEETGEVAGSENPALEEYWKEKRVGGYEALHIFFYTWMEDSRLGGLATFPDTLWPKELAWRDAIHLSADTLPGYSADEGKTTIHEIGHWLGLFHVFSGDGTCNEDTGDFISDTPLQATPSNLDCQIGRDSCPGSPGLDAIHNYMDYSSAECKSEFTEGQVKRMHNLWTSVRTALW